MTRSNSRESFFSNRPSRAVYAQDFNLVDSIEGNTDDSDDDVHRDDGDDDQGELPLDRESYDKGSDEGRDCLDGEAEFL